MNECVNYRRNILDTDWVSRTGRALYPRRPANSTIRTRPAPMPEHREPDCARGPYTPEQAVTHAKQLFITLRSRYGFSISGDFTPLEFSDIAAEIAQIRPPHPIRATAI